MTANKKCSEVCLDEATDVKCYWYNVHDDECEKGF